jgi:hypothetical protein
VTQLIASPSLIFSSLYYCELRPKKPYIYIQKSSQEISINGRKNGLMDFELGRPSHAAAGGDNTLRSGCDFNFGSLDGPEMLEFKLRLYSALPYFSL